MKTNIKHTFTLTVVVTLVLFAAFSVYNFMTFYQNGIGNIQAMGESALKSEKAQLEAYMTKGMDVLKVTSITVEYMIDEGRSAEEIQTFLVEESSRYMEDIDENFTGIYGWVLGKYVDGSGWVPDADYVPKERDWYVTAVKGEGKAVVVSPYLDAKTHTVMISVCCLLSDGDSVLSLDVVLNEIQSITEKIDLNNMGYGFITDKTGMVVAHRNSDMLGENFYENPETAKILENIDNEQDIFRVTLDGDECIVFADKVIDNMAVVLIVETGKLFGELRGILFRNVIVCVIILAIIVGFLIFAFKVVQKSMKNEENAYKRLEKTNGDIVKTIVRIIDAKDRYTNGHSQRVANYSREIARRMGKSEEEQQKIYYAGLMHDVGKIRVPDAVINKAGRLTDEEFVQIKTHPVTGYYILKEIYTDPDIINGAKYHHERYDGKGYPIGLMGQTIPEVARIVGVADAYDAMASDRSYRKALPQEVVRNEIQNGRGTQFDSDIAKIMLNMIDEDENYTMRQADPQQRTILVADRHSSTIKNVSEIFENEASYDIIVTQSYEEALSLIDSEKPDLIMWDYKLSGKKINETLMEIRRHSDSPILLVTGDKSLMSTFSFSEEMAVADIITRPISAYVLTEIVHGILDN